MRPVRQSVRHERDRADDHQHMQPQNDGLHPSGSEVPEVPADPAALSFSLLQLQRVVGVQGNTGEGSSEAIGDREAKSGVPRHDVADRGFNVLWHFACLFARNPHFIA